MNRYEIAYSADAYKPNMQPADSGEWVRWQDVQAEIERALTPEQDDFGHPPFFCRDCFWFGHDINLAGERPEDEYLTCPDCGDGVDEITDGDMAGLATLRARIQQSIWNKRGDYIYTGRHHRPTRAPRASDGGDERCR